MKINTTVADIVDIATRKLKNGEPMSHLRCGDGEVAIMNEEKFPKQFARVSLNHLGYKLDSDSAKRIKSLIDFGITHSDIIGIPEPRHLKKNNEMWNSLTQEYTRVFDDNGIKYDDKKYCSIDSHYRLLKTNELTKLIQSVDRITMITCRDIEIKFKKKYPHIKQVELIKIPAQQKYEANSTKSNFFPDIHAEVIEIIKSSSRIGQLCLFGAGFCGKDFGAHFKLSGGVAIDIGSVFDLWCGKLTRGTGKGRTAEINTYLL